MTRTGCVAAGLTVALLLAGATSGPAQLLYAPETMERYFKVEFEVTRGRTGPAVEGYIYNRANQTAQRVRLQVQRVDAAGAVVGSSARLGARRGPHGVPRVFQGGRRRSRELPRARAVVRLDLSGWRRDVVRHRPRDPAGHGAFVIHSLPISLPLLLLFVLLILLVEVRVLTYAYRKVGVHPRYAFAVMLLSLVGSVVDIPIFAIGPARAGAHVEPDRRGTERGRRADPDSRLVVSVARTRMYVRMLIGTAVVAAVVHSLAELVPGVGIAVPMIAPPLVAAGVALLLAFRRAPPVAYVAGSMGTLVGADLLNLGQIARLGAPVVSIGGAGTFDGVFLTGILAGLLA